MDDLGELHVDLRTLTELLQRRGVGGLIRVGGIERWQMIEHDAKRRHGVADAEHGFEQRHARIRRIHHEVRLGEKLEAADEIRVPGLLRNVSPPEVPIAYPAEERVLV